MLVAPGPSRQLDGVASIGGMHIGKRQSLELSQQLQHFRRQCRAVTQVFAKLFADLLDPRSIPHARPLLPNDDYCSIGGYGVLDHRLDASSVAPMPDAVKDRLWPDRERELDQGAGRSTSRKITIGLASSC
jgi:hypothetical protein